MLHSLHTFFAPYPHHTPAYFAKLVFGLLLGFAVLGLLQAAPRPWRRGIIAVFTFLGGLYYVLEFFWPADKTTHQNWLSPSQDFASSLALVVGTFAIGVGVISLLQLHGRQISRRRAGWSNSVALIVAFLAMTTFGLLNEYSPNLKVAGSVTSKDVFNFLFKGGLTNLNAATFSLIAFFIASAAYRAFRVRSLEAGFLMAAALVVMVGATFGTAITGGIPPTVNGAENPWANFRIERIAGWLLLQVNGPAQRGILFGLTVGGLAVALRLWLSLERGSYFEKEL